MIKLIACFAILISCWSLSFPPLNMKRRSIYTRLYSQRTVPKEFQEELRHLLERMRATNLKKLLEAENVNTRGMFDKSEFITAMMKLESTKRGKCFVAPFVEINLSNTKSYIGLDLMVDSVMNARFMIDTGSTINLIKKESLRKLPTPYQQQDMRGAVTASLGGQQSLASSKTSLKFTNFGGSTFQSEFAILDNSNALPVSAEGMLGLNFFQSTGSSILFDFPRRQISCGRTEDIIPSTLRSSFEIAPLRRLITDTALVDVVVEYHDGSPAPSKSIQCTASALIDTGSLYTIANSALISQMGLKLESLQPSPILCAGIDGRPMALKNISIRGLRLSQAANPFAPSESDDSGSSGIPIFAADIPGLSSLGLSNVPMIIIGMDLLCDTQLAYDFRSQRLYWKT